MRDYVIFASGALFGSAISLVSFYSGVRYYKSKKARARQEHLARAQELLEDSVTERTELED